MNKIIKMFVETDKEVAVILRQVGNPDQPLEKIFSQISTQMNSQAQLTDEMYQRIDEAIEKGHPDDQVYLLFISAIIFIFSARKMPAKSESAYRISCGLDINKYLPEVQAYYYLTCSFYYHFTADFVKRNELNLISLKKMPKNSPRYHKLLSNSAQIFGTDGRLQELPKEDLVLLEKLAENEFIAISALARNAIFTVNLKLAEKYEYILVTKFKEDKSYNNEISNSVFAILRGDLEGKNKLPSAYNIGISYYKSLRSGDLEFAKKNFGSIDKAFSEGEFNGLFFFVNYHHAFVTERYEIMESLIINQEKKEYHYLLDFFLVRYFLVKNQKDLARFFYAQLLKNCEKYQAMGRLKFEIKFAFEFSASSFFELTQPIELAISDDNSKSLAAELIRPEIITLGIKKIAGNSNAINDIKRKVKGFANIQRPVLVIGETGTGKEVVARAIHEESAHHDQPFLAINCGALTDTLLQSELFGYEAGAFTGAVASHKGIFEAAEEGTVFLDEFGEMSPKLQVSLLRVLENNEVMRVGGTKPRKIKCHIIAATNANIEDLISKKIFREDLYHRLKQFTINIPSLREHKEDIPELINIFLNPRNSEHLQSLSNVLIQKFIAYEWPGNIRELRNEIDRIKILCGYKPIIEENDIELDWINKKLLQTTIKAPNIEVKNQNPSKEQQMHQRLLERKLTSGDKRRQQIIQLFQQYKQLTRSQITDALEICSLTATKDLQLLCTQGLLIKIKPTLSPRSHYFEIIKNQG